MNNVSPDTVLDLQLKMRWQSAQATHIESYLAHRVNTWRDCLPEPLLDAMEGKTVGDTVTLDFKSGTLVPAYDPQKTLAIKRAQFNDHHFSDKPIEPRMGRFYPKGVLKDVAGIFPQNMQPFRLVGIENQSLRVDLNHPLAKTALQLQASVRKIQATPIQQGGRCHNWAEIITDGPGMQARWKNIPTRFLSDHPFERTDKASDSNFYARPRMVQHIDNTAAQVVRDLYGQLLQNDLRVLDLMSSWQSHIPVGLHLQKLTGLGLNRAELRKNNALSDWTVHDLNANPILPFEAGEYDAVICTVSVEYVVHPETVFNELGRILRPDGLLIMTFSNRWFPSKVIQIWKELHEFERVGLVLEYFQQTGQFSDLKTYSARGLPRPWDDKYFPEMRFSDPIFAVWGTKV